jgi:hypothetical protein
MTVVVCSLVLARVPSVRNFDSITLLFFDHMLDIGVNRTTGLRYQNHERRYTSQKPDMHATIVILRLSKWDNS